ncbi:MAG TPA: LiaF domain-containing protein [Acidimicrobiales bacterium]|nr:LiaF domain-containing protein [Acidimicrobiales bacterium]
MTAGTGPIRRRHSDRGLLGALLLVIGAAWLIGDLRILSLSSETLLSALLIVTGLGVLANPRSRRRWPLILGAVVTFALATSTVHLSLPNSHSVGDRLVQPAGAATLQPAYSLGTGNMTLDLTTVSLPAGLHPVNVSVGAGNLEVLVPDNVGISVHAQDGVGSITLPGGASSGGLGVTRDWQSQRYSHDAVQLQLHLHVGVGDIVVRTEPPASDSSVVPTPTAPTAPAAPKAPGAPGKGSL